MLNCPAVEPLHLNLTILGSHVTIHVFKSDGCLFDFEI